MYNAGPELSFVGPVLDQNCLQRLAIGKELTLVVCFHLCVCVRLCPMSFNCRVIGWTVIVAFYLHFLFSVVFMPRHDNGRGIKYYPCPSVLYVRTSVSTTSAL